MAPRSPWTKQLLREHYAEIGRVPFKRTQQQARGKVGREGKRVQEHEAAAGKRKRYDAANDDCHGGRTTSPDAETGRSSGSGKSRRRRTTAGRPPEVTTTPRRPAATSWSWPEGRAPLPEPQLHCCSSRGAASASSISPRPSWGAYFHAKLSHGLPLPLQLLHSQELPLPLPLPLLHTHVLPHSLPLAFSRAFESPDVVNQGGECGAAGGRLMVEASVGARSASVSPYAVPAADFVVLDLNLPPAADDASARATGGGASRGLGGGDGGDASGAGLTAVADCGRTQSACESDRLDGCIRDALSASGLVTLSARLGGFKGAALSSGSSKLIGSQLQMQQ